MTGPQRFDGFHGFSQTGFNVMSSVSKYPRHRPHLEWKTMQLRARSNSARASARRPQEPGIPSSSPVNNTNRIERRGEYRCGEYRERLRSRRSIAAVVNPFQAVRPGVKMRADSTHSSGFSRRGFPRRRFAVPWDRHWVRVLLSVDFTPRREMRRRPRLWRAPRGRAQSLDRQYSSVRRGVFSKR